MKSLEYSTEGINIEKKGTLEDDEKDLIDRYEVEDNKKSQFDFYLERKKNRALPFLLFIFIISVLIFFIFLLFFIIKSISIKNNYKYRYDEIEKPKLSQFKYSNLTFDNKLEVLLVQVEENDTAGGSIIFDTGYLDNQYEFGELKIAFFSLINVIINKTTHLSDYLGDTKYEVDQYYSYFSFNILNAGFFEYLEVFKNLNFFNDEEIIKKQIKEVNNTRATNITDFEGREKFIFEYKVYGCENILGDNETIHFAYRNVTRIKEIIKKLLQPNRIKIVLASHFKPSLMKKKFLLDFENLINAKPNNEIIESFNNIDNNFSTKKIIFFRTTSFSEVNYLKISFFIDKEENEDYYELINNLGYFNYIKYILDETSEGSLYHQLNNGNKFNIKSLSCDYEIVLKSKIKFSIKIDLAPSSYPYIEDILFMTYQYINKLIKYIIDEEESSYREKRLKEIDTINKQTFIFAEDANDISSFTKMIGIKLCNKRKKDNFFKDNWLKNFDLSIANKYYSQLIADNSVITIGLNIKHLEIAGKRESNIKFNDFDILLNNTKNIRSYHLEYSLVDLNTDFIKYYKDDNINIGFHENKYISTHLDIIKTDKNDEDSFKFTTTILNKTNFSEFRYLRDTRFRLPKVHIALNLFHPFIRPGLKSEMRNCFYFEYLLYMVFIKRQINEKLSDAIRAGNKFSINYNQNYIYLDIFAFSDIAWDLVSKIKDIIMDIDSFSEIHNNIDKFKLYMQITLDDYLNIRKVRSYKKDQSILYYILNPYLYKYYEFPESLNNADIFQKECKGVFEKNEYLRYFLIDCQIYGYYEKDQAIKFIDLFKDLKNDEEIFQGILEAVSLHDQNLTLNNFKDWIKEEYFDLGLNKLIIPKNIGHNDRYWFINWSDYSIISKVKTSIFETIIKGLKNIYDYNLTFSFINHNSSYLLIYIHSRRNSLNSSEYPNESIYEDIKNKIIEEYNNKREIYDGKKIDVVGNRFYYLIKNTIDRQYIRPRDMENSAIKLLNSEIYTPDDLALLNKETKNLKQMKYDELLNKFKEIYKKKNFFEAFSQNN